MLPRQVGYCSFMTKLVCAERSDDKPPRVAFGPPLKSHLNVFQGFVLPVFSSEAVPDLVARLQAHPRLRLSTHLPYAYRIIGPSPERQQQDDSQEKELVTTESSHDGNILGAGDKLLQVLRRWEVCNAVVVVSRADRSLTGRLIVAQIYQLVVESAKLALEQFAVESLHPSEAAKLALHELGRSKESNEKEPHLTVQEMTYVGKQTRMVAGVVQGTKQGRINHFNQENTKDSMENQGNRARSLEPIGVSKEEFASLKALRMPPKELHMVLVCIAVLLNEKDISWLGCREMLHHPSFCTRVLHLDPTKLTKKQASRVRTILQEPQFVPELVRRVSAVGATLLTWVMQVMDMYDSTQLGFELQGPAIDIENDTVPPSSNNTAADPWVIERPEPHPPPAKHELIPTDLFEAPKVPVIQDLGRML
ncbi:hypothetical protein AeMF1_009100 [Aphanomyces euteiches]|nr:hypothetical protein AeMF1_009100 [Aphanomyces euteiches]KAH9197973.1 hypothetical protein AeNC1_000064 [Aphanomyces euteiches]